MDSLAFIGHNPGHNGKNPWQDLYDPSRRILSMAGTLTFIC